MIDLLPLISIESIAGRSTHRDDQRIAVALEFDVAKIAGCKQQADQLAGRRFVDLIADVDRQQVEHGSRGNALQPLNADVRHGERIGEREPRPQQRDGDPSLQRSPKHGLPRVRIIV